MPRWFKDWAPWLLSALAWFGSSFVDPKTRRLEAVETALNDERKDVRDLRTLMLCVVYGGDPKACAKEVR